MDEGETATVAETVTDTTGEVVGDQDTNANDAVVDPTSVVAPADLPQLPGDAQLPPTLASQQPIDPELVRLHFSISTAFKLFDNEDRNQVDVSELGTVIRSLGCCPSEEDLRDIILECEEEESTGTIKYDRFEPVMTRILKEKKYKSVSVDKLVEAFQVLDSEGEGMLDPDTLSELLTTKGEPFSAEEVQEMFDAAVDVDNKLYYEDHAVIMALDDNKYLVQ